MAIAADGTARGDVTLSFSGRVVTDPLGIELDVSVADRAPPPVTQALLADARDQLVGGQGNLVFQSVRVAHGALRSYGARLGYDVEPVTESVEVISVDESPSRLSLRWGWLHEAAPFFHFGTSEHVIEGDPLAFEWPAVGDGVFFFERVEHPGIPESNYVSAGLEWLRQEIQ